MPHDDRVDAYIARAAPFAQPILAHFRARVHQAVPGATETIKWGMPFFEAGGKALAMMAAFKAHAGCGIFDGTAMARGDGMGNLGKLIQVSDLPPDAVLLGRLQAAHDLVRGGRGGMAEAVRPRQPKPDIPMPDDLAGALAATPAAQAGFAALPPGARREYLEWVTSARQAATRARRIATTVAQASEGKKLNWKYEDC